ncbi:MAG: HAD family hydrolase, partial [Bacteroidota bacterium]
MNKLLILDLDETLIHARKRPHSHPPDFETDYYFVYIRPGLADFLTTAAQHFDLAIWSSAGDDYVHEIVAHIQPPGIEFQFVWGRSRCTKTRDYELDEYVYEKRLKKVKRKGYALEQILIVDDSREKLRANYGNAIYMKPFLGEQADEELELLGAYLEDRLMDHNASRRRISDCWATHGTRIKSLQ